MRKIREALRLKHEHQASQHEIARSVGVVQSTAGDILRRAEAAGLCWPLPESFTDEDLNRLLYPPRRLPSEPPRALADWRVIDAELSKKGVTLLLLWMEYKRQHPSGYEYSRFAELFREWKGKTDLRMCQRHRAGQKLFIDFAGLTMPVTDPSTGVVRQVPIFASAMGASQRIYASACESQTTESWLKGLCDSFEFYGALPEILVPDNPKPCVTDPDRYEPVINPSFAECARYYGIAVIPARVRKPRDKAKVENAVLQVERWILAPLRHQTFFSLEELRIAIAAQVEDLDVRVMREYGASRRELFEQIDRPAMRELPESRYRFATWKRAKVGPDYHIVPEGHRYSVPYNLVGSQVDLRLTPDTVEIFKGSKRIYTHPKALVRHGFTTEPTHMPSHHKEFAEWTPERIERWALSIGPNVSRFVAQVMDGKQHPEQAFNSCMGVISLSRKYGEQRVEAACLRGLSFGARSYRNIKIILQKGLDQQAPEQLALAGVSHSNVRGAGYFAQGVPCDN